MPMLHQLGFRSKWTVGLAIMLLGLSAYTSLADDSEPPLAELFEYSLDEPMPLPTQSPASKPAGPVAEVREKHGQLPCDTAATGEAPQVPPGLENVAIAPQPTGPPSAEGPSRAAAAPQC